MSGGDELVAVAFANDQVEAEMVQGLLKGAGIPSLVQPLSVNGPQVGIGWLNPGGGSRRVLVRADCSEKARALLAETLVEDEETLPEPVNAGYLEEGCGRKPRGYGLIGAYTRIWGWSFGVLALVFVVFLLLRSV